MHFLAIEAGSLLRVSAVVLSGLLGPGAAAALLTVSAQNSVRGYSGTTSRTA
jgi:hypothetical protein